MPDPAENVTDAAAKLAEKLDVDLSEVKGTGAGGRIIEADVALAAEPHPAEAATEAVEDVEAATGDDQFDHDWLIRNGSVAVGHSPPVVAGALAGVDQDKLTIAETKAACERWLAAPAKVN